MVIYMMGSIIIEYHNEHRWH